MPKDRDQLTPEEPDDAARLAASRGKGTAGSGEDLLPGEAGSRWGTIEVWSEAFEPGDLLPDRYAHDRDNVSPPLSWSGVPPSTVELVLLCQDPDALGGTFTHWVVTGIDPSATGVAEGTVPAGATEGVNDFGHPGWGGPEPPPGDPAHRYVFTVVASGARLGLGADARGEDVAASLGRNEVARGEISALYRRPPAPA
ncbi:MAG TPA: YbhB/YbcL family Raf kinase inhibitor-like protein [Acidimicrobiales bacterium]|nr:YbhB/YbcL family Raf kinase inhibitor-like protein [Acidimicrobiales bacterium]